MASTDRSKLNMKHGFMQSIIKNQIDRDNYDKEVKAARGNRRGGFNPNRRPKRPDAQVYLPPKREDWDEPEQSSSSDEDDMPKTLFVLAFEDKDGKIYRQYVKEGVDASVLAMRMGYDRKLPERLVKALQQRLEEEISKRTKS